MQSILLTSTAKQTCNSLVFIAEKTDDEVLFNICMETIIHLCKSFDITAFGSLPQYCNRSPIFNGIP